MKSSDAHCGRLSGEVPVCLVSLEGIGGGGRWRETPASPRSQQETWAKKPSDRVIGPSQLLGHLPRDGKNKADEPVLGASGGRQARAACVFQ